MKRKYYSLFLALALASPQSKAQEAQKRYFDVNKNIEIFNSVVKELDMFYVDSLDVEKSIQSGIVNMLAGLDPYTNYMTEKETEEFNVLTKGEYAGIGSYISPRKFDEGYRVVITEPYEGKPAQKAGLRGGDIILEVDGENMIIDANSPNSAIADLSSNVSNKLKGQPGTTLKVKVQRPGEKKPKEFTIQREIVQVGAVPYYGILQEGIGYISFSGFTDKSAQEVKKAFLDLKKQGITSLVLDLRSNTGGILEEAVQLVNFFVPKDEVVLSTKGKLKQSDRVYKTTSTPIDLDIPLAVLVDRSTASASEIVSGALQDKDRAVIIGERTFGKGLVQVTRELPYNGSLKITTSKYYIPSGRCVQAIDYAHKNEDGSVARIPDSLTTVFKTAIGREVRDGGGVVPDIAIKDEKTPSIAYYLVNQNIIFDFVTEWSNKHSKVEPVETFVLSDADYDEFKEFVKAKKDFKYDMLSEKTLNSLKEVMEFEGYMNTANDEYKLLEAKLTPNLDRDLDNFREVISGMISRELMKRYYFQKGEIIEELKSSKEIKEAIAVLTDLNRYNEILSPKPIIVEETVAQ